jgi:hypothetical protein
MSAICLDTDDLKDKSSVFHSFANAFAQSGKSLLDACNVTTPYANLNALSREAGNEMHAGLQDLSRKFTEHAEYLKETAEVFEKADSEIIGAIKSATSNMERNSSFPRSTDLPPRPEDKPQFGDYNWGYAYGPNNTITIWWEGRYVVYSLDKNGPHYKEIIDFVNNFTEYNQLLYKLTTDIIHAIPISFAFGIFVSVVSAISDYFEYGKPGDNRANAIEIESFLEYVGKRSAKFGGEQSVKKIVFVLNTLEVVNDMHELHEKLDAESKIASLLVDPRNSDMLRSGKYPEYYGLPGDCGVEDLKYQENPIYIEGTPVTHNAPTPSSNYKNPKIETETPAPNNSASTPGTP